MSSNEPFDWSALRERLPQGDGRNYWRSLEELADSPVFREYVQRQFPAGALEPLDATSRRAFLSLMGASLALAGLGGCARRPEETIVPYVHQPERIIPGQPLHFATAMTFDGYATGILVESHMGRPTKVEGNPDHPASLGASDIFAQASVLDLYDPDRSQTVTNAGQISTWDAFLTSLQPVLAAQVAKRGRGLRILTQTVASPTLAWQLESLLTALPEAKWHCYQPVNSDQARAAARMAFGREVHVLHDFL
jgi:molybdopterin-containing oxidoreductase family iron-sulfur binding subunit